MKHLVFTITLFASIIYFAIASILGLSGDTSEGSGPFYKVYCILVFLLFFSFYIKNGFRHGIDSSHSLTILIFFVFALSGLISGYATDTSMLVLIAFGFPAAGVAVYYAEHGNISCILKWVDIFLPIISISLIFSLRQLLREIQEGTSYYSQGLSYYAAYCFILYLFFLLFGSEYERFAIFKKRFYKVISIIMLPYLIVVLFFSGGRGALGTLLAGVVVLLYFYKKKYGIKRKLFLKGIKGIITFIFLAIILSLLIPDDSIDVFFRNFNRVFSFFDSNKDIFERASGRDDVLNVAFSQINQNPIFGSGLFMYKDRFYIDSEVPYPHNLFVEVLLQGGVVYLFFFLLFLWKIFVKLYYISKLPRQELILIFMVFSMTMLMYSGSYMQNSFFCFFVFYVLNFNIRKVNAKKNIVHLDDVSKSI